MPKRIIDGEGLWRSSKLASIPEQELRMHYAWLLPLATSNGVFELDADMIWSCAYSYYDSSSGSVSREDVREILAVFHRRRLLFPFEAEGKRWGYWVGIEKPGRLPAPARRGVNEKCGPPPPPYQLRQFIDGHPEDGEALWSPAEGLIYFVQGKKTKLIKIGWALYPKRRLQALQIGSPDVLMLLGFCPGQRIGEAELHTRWAQHRIRGEWFRPDREILDFIANECALEVGVRSPPGVRTDSAPNPKPNPKPDPRPDPDPNSTNSEIGIDLPDWVPQREWLDFVDNRARIHKPIRTPAQAMYCLRQLDKLRRDGDDPAEVLARSIAGNWQGLFPLRNGAKNERPDVHEQTRRNAAIAWENIQRRERESEAGVEDCAAAGGGAAAAERSFAAKSGGD